MKRVIALAIVVSSVFASAVFVPSPMASAAARQKVRASVMGTGNTKGTARNDAKQKGYELAGTFTFRIVSESSTGSGSSWTCSMVIEYEPR